MLTWCTMPVPGGTTRKPLNALLAPAQELEALAVALELELHVPLEGVGAAEDVGDHGVVDDQLGGDEGVDLRRVAAEARMASRMAARSTTAGTPVRSCRITRAGVNWISVSGSFFGSQFARRGCGRWLC